MTDLSEVRIVAAGLSLSESEVGTAAKVEAMAELKRASLAAHSDDASLAKWLSDEHYAGGVYLTAATMNKRAEISGKGDAFDAISRRELIARYNRWASQLVERLDRVEEGSAAPAQYLDQHARFRADPIHAEP
ncbi:hypothetical protein ACFC14_18675 [Microbacterium sp. NPDC055988]|uniref:hypothetical protein n=1 Tax=Microbacterium sp. NPDC055988 TaxID=3345671 RepID=UPI0035D7B9A2